MQEQYRAIREGAAVLRLTGTAFLELRGRDRVRFLHNLCTNDIYRLATGRDGVTFGKQVKLDLSRTPSGRGCLAATLTRQGKMVAAYKVRMYEDRILLEVPGEAAAALKGDLEKAIIMDQVELRDLSPELAHFHVAGPKARSVISADVPEFHFVERDAALISPFRITGEEGFDVIVPADRADATWKDLSSKATPVELGALEAARIENGWPRWGLDMGPDTLPMEAGLEPVAISYSKGCYLGQEIVQRVKTYGEVARRLASLAIDGGNVPPPGSAITADGADAGRVTSSAMASRPVALGMMKKSHKEPETRVEVAGTPAVVQELRWHSRV